MPIHQSAFLLNDIVFNKYDELEELTNISNRQYDLSEHNSSEIRSLLLALLKFLFLILLLISFSKTSYGQSHGHLKVSPNHHYLEYSDGTPFFYLGDTAWYLFRRLNLKQADYYLKNRANKGFTVIQASLLESGGDFNKPNALGDKPLIDGDPTKPNPAYFKYVDQVVNEAQKLGLHIGMLPTWGGNWARFNKKPPYVFNVKNAKIYGEFLGKRYKKKPVIWILGGDTGVYSPKERAILKSMAEGLNEGVGGDHLITFHPVGPGMSSQFLPHAKWINFNMSQTSHSARNIDTGIFIHHDYNLKPTKPTLDGEPAYEMMPVGFYFKNYNRYNRFTSYAVRQGAYWSILAGACGFTYGNNNIWQFYDTDVKPKDWADIPWKEALNEPGAFDMTYVKQLFESVPFEEMKPCQKMIVSGPDHGGAKIRAAVARDRSFAIIYTPQGKSFTVDRSYLKVKGRTLKVIWYNPRYGVAHWVHTSDNSAYQTYTPPTSGKKTDWILLLEDGAKHYPLPGAKHSVSKK